MSPLRSTPRTICRKSSTARRPLTPSPTCCAGWGMRSSSSATAPPCSASFWTIRRTSSSTWPRAGAAVVEQGRGGYRQPVLVEEFIQGDELTVGLVGNGTPEVVGVMRVVPNTPTQHFIYGLEVKRDYLRQVRYECPPPYPPEL